MANVTVQCPFDPNIYEGQPIGMFHCPWCGEMQLAGYEHTPHMITVDEAEYVEFVENMVEIRALLNKSP